MKFQLTGTDLLEDHHIYGLIRQFCMDNDGREPKYIIIHPETSYRIQAQIADSEMSFTIIRYDYQKEHPKISLYGISLLRTFDIEEGFIELV